MSGKGSEFYDEEIITVFENLDVWADMDGDGYGDPSIPINGCDPDNTTPFAYNGEDCNDEDASMYPGGSGTFEGLDNNCDEIIEGDEEIAIEGCMDPLASNYNPSASVSDDSCIYIECLGDFNFDGTITVSDLLDLLAEFGCSENCITDMNADEYVSVADLLALLAVFGTSCD
jgi:hypothetical protein